MVIDSHISFPGLPRMDITLLGGKVIGDINKVDKLNGTMVLSNGYGSGFPTDQLYNGNITIKGRGNSTWFFPKKPYTLVTANSSFGKNVVSLAGLPADSDWTLLAEYPDKTHWRTLFTSALSYALGLPWASRCIKVEVWMNGDYIGLYTLCEKVKASPARINITTIKKTDISGAALTGGYVWEHLFPEQLESNEVRFTDTEGSTFSYKVPDSTDVTSEQNGYSQAFWNDFLDRVYNHDLDDLTNGYRSVSDPVSFAQYFLLQDISKNCDTYQGSWYFTKDRNGLLKAGPFWDANGCWALVDIQIDYLPSPADQVYFGEPRGTYVPIAAPYYARLLEDPYFSGLVKSTFDSTLQAINRTYANLRLFIPQLVATGAIDRDRARWPDFLDIPVYVPLPNYQADCDRVTGFIEARLYDQIRGIYQPVTKKPATVPV